MIDFESFQNHRFWQVAARACRKSMVLQSYSDHLNDFYDIQQYQNIMIFNMIIIMHFLCDLEESASHPYPSPRGSAPSSYIEASHYGAKHFPPGRRGPPDGLGGVPPPRGPEGFMIHNIHRQSSSNVSI